MMKTLVMILCLSAVAGNIEANESNIPEVNLYEQDDEIDYSLDFVLLTAAIDMDMEDDVARFFLLPADFEDVSRHIFDEGFKAAINDIEYEDIPYSKIKDDNGNVIDVKELAVTWNYAFYSDEPEPFTITFIMQELETGLMITEVFIPEPF